MNYKYRSIKDERGFTIIELIMAITITGIIAALFSQILGAVIEIYVDRSMRKTSHIDERRASALILRDLKENVAWVGEPSSTNLTFDKTQKSLSPGDVIYYHDLQVGFTISNGQINYQTEEGEWGNLYPLILEGVVAGDSQFTITTEGGVVRITTEIVLNVLDKPMRVRCAVYPRWQGG